jgi:hypothetical protein
MTTTYRSNSKEVMNKVTEHVRDFYESKADLIADYQAVAEKAKSLVEDGNFLINYYEQREFLNSLHLNNNSGREFTDEEVFKMYVALVSRAIEKEVKN